MPNDRSGEVLAVAELGTQERIEAVALRSFAEFGYHASSMRMIARDANVQPASLYHWYPSKESLLVMLMRRFMDGLSEEVWQAVEAEQGPIERLAAAVRSHVVYHGSHRPDAFVTDSEVRALTGQHRTNVMRLRDEYERRFTRLITDGEAAGVFRCQDAGVASYAILLACTGVATWFRPDGKRTLSEVADIHVELVLRSLGTPHSHER